MILGRGTGTAVILMLEFVGNELLIPGTMEIGRLVLPLTGGPKGATGKAAGVAEAKGAETGRTVELGAGVGPGAGVAGRASAAPAGFKVGDALTLGRGFGVEPAGEGGRGEAGSLVGVPPGGVLGVLAPEGPFPVGEVPPAVALALFNSP